MGHGEEVAALVPQGMGSVTNPGRVPSLNCLPDDLLVQILSLLPLKQAASTSVLSTRWRTLFTFRHNLDFDDSIFSHPEEGKRDRRDIQMSFRCFVYKTLASQGGNRLNKFSLKCEDVDDVVHVDRWICNALEYGVLGPNMWQKKTKSGHNS